MTTETEAIDSLTRRKRPFILRWAIVMGALTSLFVIPVAQDVFDDHSVLFAIGVGIAIFGAAATWSGIMWEIVGKPHLARVERLKRQAEVRTP